MDKYHSMDTTGGYVSGDARQDICEMDYGQKI
jgi:hypothetical protein